MLVGSIRWRSTSPSFNVRFSHPTISTLWQNWRRLYSPSRNVMKSPPLFPVDLYSRRLGKTHDPPQRQDPYPGSLTPLRKYVTVIPNGSTKPGPDVRRPPNRRDLQAWKRLAFHQFAVFRSGAAQAGSGRPVLSYT